MKIKRKKRIKMVEIIVVILCIFVIIIFKNYYKNDTKKILREGEYTIGTVLIYSKGNSPIYSPKGINKPGQARSVRFEYIVNNIKYIHNYSANKSYVPREGVEVGHKYLIVYLKEYPQRSRILFDKPIRNSSDFEQYLKELEK